MDNLKFGAFVVAFVGSIALIIVLVINVAKGLRKGAEKVIDNQKELKQNLGSKLVIDKDTLTIVDYSTVNQNYTLSTGAKVSKRLADSLVVKFNKP
jgi:hypothetical protein